ncbi:O-fucosyltransferase family protein [Euphorbia peplus]|nr:O-fucosyltransferase family protein [Euphorbia peplus]
MGKQGSQRSPRPKLSSSGAKGDHVRSSESLVMSDHGRRFSGGDNNWKTKVNDLKNENGKLGCKGVYVGKRNTWFHRHIKSIATMFALLGFLFLLDSFMVSFFDSLNFQNGSTSSKSSSVKDGGTAYETIEKPPVQMYSRLLNLASNSLAEKEFKPQKSSFWEEPYQKASLWKPCADKMKSVRIGKPSKNNGYLLVSANGGLNQQRVAICNAVALASLLNATLVVPKFLYSNVWKDPSQFGDIYQEEYFMNKMKDEIEIVKELPSHLKSLDIEAIGSQITDADIPKEARPSDYLEKVLPILLKNKVVHFLGFGNRLGFDPVSSQLQRLRCKCNFHALKFAPKIQQAGSLLIRRIRKYDSAHSMLDKELLGDFMPGSPLTNDPSKGPSKYLALHLRFEVDMIAYSLCEFGGGEDEKKELKAYRESHFPLLIERVKNSEPIIPSELRRLGRCPLTPEEAALVLAGLGFKRGTYIYLASSQIYGGKSRMHPFTNLYPNLVTKETLLTPKELAPFTNFSSQMAALDFIACATSDVFAMTDSGSQLSSLVSGFRTYYGGGHAPILRPNKKRLAAILSQNNTIEWNTFGDRVRKMIEEGQKVQLRSFGRSIYRQPRCSECMCKQ